MYAMDYRAIYAPDRYCQTPVLMCAVCLLGSQHKEHLKELVL